MYDATVVLWTFTVRSAHTWQNNPTRASFSWTITAIKDCPSHAKKATWQQRGLTVVTLSADVSSYSGFGKSLGNATIRGSAFWLRKYGNADNARGQSVVSTVLGILALLDSHQHTALHFASTRNTSSHNYCITNRRNKPCSKELPTMALKPVDHMMRVLRGVPSK